jgi:uncharacterized RDD family membrane protein YckC
MTSRFEPEKLTPKLNGSDANGVRPCPALLAKSSVSPPKFQIEENSEPSGPFIQPTTPPVETLETSRNHQNAETADSSQPYDDLWRQEVAAKLNRYRARKRAATPRYPSLQLKFDDSAWNRQSSQQEHPPSRLAVAIQSAASEASAVEFTAPVVEEPAQPDATAKVIEFPRFFATPEITFDELAEPVMDRPRILEVPEQLPPPPALGGILIEPQEQSPTERRPGFELPLNPPAMSRRLAAGLIDALIIFTAFAGFGFIAFRIVASLPPLRDAVAISAGLIALFWGAYQYAFLVYSGTTPGLKLAKLSLNRFSGAPVPRRLRRWRVLASLLSALSLGLGYAWCWLDEDQLCWHDRITRTYMAKAFSPQETAAGD